MDLRKRNYVAVAFGSTAIAIGVFSSFASAATITENFTFTSTGYGIGAPAATVDGNFDLTFDPTHSYSTDTTAGFTLNLLSPAQLGDSGLGFIYDDVDGGLLEIGGLADGVDDIVPGTDDFYLIVDDVQTTPSFLSVNYSESGYDQTYADTAGTVIGAVVPEPMSSAVIIAGTAVMLLRRRSPTVSFE